MLCPKSPEACDKQKLRSPPQGQNFQCFTTSHTQKNPNHTSKGQGPGSLLCFEILNQTPRFPFLLWVRWVTRLQPPQSCNGPSASSFPSPPCFWWILQMLARYSKLHTTKYVCAKGGAGMISPASRRRIYIHSSPTTETRTYPGGVCDGYEQYRDKAAQLWEGASQRRAVKNGGVLKWQSY